ncbi:hypothetical protein [Bradyrhizobium sp. 143]|uniref:hypothetical protein n=1 Tax=Bradyrhizobium sp. 143 TaxID=2782619 RepID=UPI001FF7573B|nr:hypothetical protein [Bradyrhizobium sp. 143]MCK1715061.1 hypothetical protein [Bradyrhizobium sp. 143]
MAVSQAARRPPVGCRDRASSQAIDIARIAGDPDPAVTVAVANGNTIVHIAWDVSHSSNIVLSGVQLSSFVAGQDFHLV